MKAPVKKQIGPLRTFVAEGKPGGPAVVLFHGYGADASDLIPLAEMMDLNEDVTWVFPDAPLEIIIAPGFRGRAWFSIDTRRLENALANGEPADLSQTTPEGLESARKAATGFYDDLLKKHSPVILGGFSQGAMLALELALTHARKPDGLVLMSGSLLNEERWSALADTCNGMTFIQTHGKNDALLGYPYAERLYDVLSKGGMFGEFVAFNGGHEIPPKAIEKIASYLQGILRPRRK